jgi:hypothetical protein
MTKGLKREAERTAVVVGQAGVHGAGLEAVRADVPHSLVPGLSAPKAGGDYGAAQGERAQGALGALVRRGLGTLFRNSNTRWQEAAHRTPPPQRSRPRQLCPLGGVCSGH